MTFDDYSEITRRVDEDATQHSMSNPLVEVDGDRARCRMYMQAEHFFSNDQGSAERLGRQETP